VDQLGLFDDHNQDMGEAPGVHWSNEV